MDYKKYSLKKLEEWMHDCISSGEASPQEIYNTIKNVVEEQHIYYKIGASKTNELLSLLNGNGVDHIEAYDDYLTTKSKMKCDRNDPSPKCKSSWNSFWNDSMYSSDCISSFGTDNYTVLGATNVPAYGGNDVITFEEPKKDKVVKWQLPVEVDDAAGDANPIYYVNFPDDLLEAANLKEGDVVEWVDQGDGSYLLRKI